MQFHERFDIELSLDEARRRFVNRALNSVFTNSMFDDMLNSDSRKYIATAIGKRYEPGWYKLDLYITNFHECLMALEAAYNMLPGTDFACDIEAQIMWMLDQSESDIGVKWEDGRFWRTGAKLLDEELINNQLKWMANGRLEPVRTPFAKALQHLLEAEENDAVLSKIITDAYESLEALSKIITNRPNKDLSGNKELMLSKVAASDEMKQILNSYIPFANRFRHAESTGTPKPKLTKAEAEYFVYLTGAFIRLAIERGVI
jgi:hypothetical protein